MTAERWTQAVRQTLGYGRLLPLGTAHDGAWLAESAAVAWLRRSVQDVPGVRVGALRVRAADAAERHHAVVPLPPSALEPGPLRVEGEFAALAGEPLPAAADRLRAALAATAETLGLRTAAVDLRVTELADDPDELSALGAAADGDDEGRDSEPGLPDAHGHAGQLSENGNGDSARVAAAARAVPGVARLTGAFGTSRRAVHIEDRPRAAGAAGLVARHVRVDVAVLAEHGPVGVARAVRAAATGALADRPTAAVLVTHLV